MTYYKVAGVPYPAELYHHGIKGQKWGVRRFQEENGTLTSAGRDRYASAIKKSIVNAKNNSETKAKIKKAAKIAAVTAGTALAAYGTYKLAKSGALGDMADSLGGKVKRLTTDVKGNPDRVRKSFVNKNRAAKALKRANTASRLHDAAFSFKLSDKDLLEKIGRLENEKKLMDLTYESITNSPDPKKRILINAGKKAAETVLAGAGVYGVKALLTKKISPKEAADYLAPKPKKK